ncbi:MAG: UDP-N-acetylmuramate dehydrogenase, partial [Bacteroidia bacterium]
MKTEHNVSLKSFNTFGVEASAKQLVRLDSPEDVGNLPSGSFDRDADLVLGGGSNILFCSDIPGTLYLNRIKGRRIISEDNDSVLIEVAAGENWHEFVLWTIDQGFSGLENLSLIPGL